MTTWRLWHSLEISLWELQFPLWTLSLLRAEQLCEAGEEKRVLLPDTEPCPGTIPHGGEPWSDLLEKVPYIQGLAGSPSNCTSLVIHLISQGNSEQIFLFFSFDHATWLVGS